MDRRNFLQLACLAVAGKAVERTFPFRVYSIPKEIVVPKPEDVPIFQLLQHLPSGFTQYEVYTMSGRVQAKFSAPSLLHIDQAIKWAIDHKSYPRIDHPSIIGALPY